MKIRQYLPELSKKIQVSRFLWTTVYKQQLLLLKFNAADVVWSLCDIDQTISRCDVGF